MRFSHATDAHRRACDSCHEFPSKNWKTVRSADAFPDVTEYPTHSSCIGCHRQQFFARERPAPRICAVCHVTASPRDTTRHPFANPSATFLASKKGREFVHEFRVRFPHGTHMDMLGARGAPETESLGGPVLRVAARSQEAAKGAGVCATCHQLYDPQGDTRDEYATTPPKALGAAFWLKKGTFQTSPSGHDACFSCHSVDGGIKPAPSDCAMCHTLAAPEAAATDFDAALAAAMDVDPAALRLWRRRNSSATYRHEGGLHTEIACTSCHDIAAMDAADARAKRVRVPSCGGDMGCHVTATLDEGGALNAELEARTADPGFRCTKCHLAYASGAVPQTHLDAIAKLRGN
jgi:hypothetical protein